MATMVQKYCISISYPSKMVKNGARMVQMLWGGEGGDLVWDLE